MHRYLLAALIAVVVGLWGGMKAFAGEPHQKPPRQDYSSPAAPAVAVSPSVAASPTMSLDASPSAGASATATAGGGNSSIASSVRAFSLGTSAAVSPASCDSAVLSGVWVKESWTCALLKRIEVAEALGQRAVALQIACMDEVMRAGVEAMFGTRACRTEVHPYSRYGAQHSYDQAPAQ